MKLNQFYLPLFLFIFRALCFSIRMCTNAQSSSSRNKNSCKIVFQRFLSSGFSHQIAIRIGFSSRFSQIPFYLSPARVSVSPRIRMNKKFISSCDSFVRSSSVALPGLWILNRIFLPQSLPSAVAVPTNMNMKKRKSTRQINCELPYQFTFRLFLSSRAYFLAWNNPLQFTPSRWIKTVTSSLTRQSAAERSRF